jgi:hypothetical protein
MTARAERILVELSARRKKFAEYDEVGSLNLTAAILAAVHDTIVGNVPAISADRSPRLRRRQLDGSYSLPVEDLLYIALTHGGVGRIVLERIAERLGYEPPAPRLQAAGSLQDIHREMADVVTSFADAIASWSETIADGRISSLEAVDLEERISRLIREAVELRTIVWEHIR